jgi:uncharacterized Zn-finger protein
VKRHWKKFLKDQAAVGNSSGGASPGASPAKKLKSFGAKIEPQEEAENLCMSDLHRMTESTVAQALLSLGRSPVRQTLPLQPLPLPLQHSHQRQTFPINSHANQIRLPQHPAPFQYSDLFMCPQPISFKQIQPQLHQQQQQQQHLTQFTFREIRLQQLQLQQQQQQQQRQKQQHQQPTPELPFHELRPQQHQHQLPAHRLCTSPPSSSKIETSSQAFRLLLPTIPETRPQTLEFSRQESKPSKKPYFCQECKKGFSTQSGHIKHQELHRANQIQKTFSCKFCNKGYTSLSALKMHTRTHTLPCKCNICGKSFSRPWLLQGHVRTHTGEKPFECSFCSRSFADKSNLRAHLQTHLQTKKYSCQNCQKTFSRMSLLNKHSENGCQTKMAATAESGFSTALIRA